MPVNRNLNGQAITKNNAPPWECPICCTGTLRLHEESLSNGMTASCQKDFNKEWFDFDQIEYRFTALLKCDNAVCEEIFSIAGDGKVLEFNSDPECGNSEYEDCFYPTYFNPSPSLIYIPPKCPAEVRKQLDAAFISSWGDAAAAANRIRVAAELLLTALRVPKTRNDKGKRKGIPLHARIGKLPGRHAGVRDSLLAIKWLGNHGTHQMMMDRDAVYDALDIFELVLARLYSDHPQNIEKLIKKVNRRRGPIRKNR